MVCGPISTTACGFRATWQGTRRTVRPRHMALRPLAGEPDSGAEQIGVVSADRRLAGARALSCPQARQAILLATSPEPDLAFPRSSAICHLERVGEVFFKRLDDPLSCLGRAKPSSPSSLDIPIDHPLQSADNPVHRRIGAGLDNLAKFFQRLAQAKPVRPKDLIRLFAARLSGPRPRLDIWAGQQRRRCCVTCRRTGNLGDFDEGSKWRLYFGAISFRAILHGDPRSTWAQ